MNSSYNQNNKNIESHLYCLSRSIDSLSSKYEKIILLGDFNSCMDDSPMIGFCETYKLRNLAKPLSFQTTCDRDRNSDFHKMIVALMKTHFPKIKPRVIRYRKN